MLPYLNNFFKGTRGLGDLWCRSARRTSTHRVADHRHWKAFCPVVVRIGRFGAYLEAKPRG